MDYVLCIDDVGYLQPNGSFGPSETAMRMGHALAQLKRQEIGEGDIVVADSGYPEPDHCTCCGLPPECCYYGKD